MFLVAAVIPSFWFLFGFDPYWLGSVVLMWCLLWLTTMRHRFFRKHFRVINSIGFAYQVGGCCVVV